MQIPFVGRKFHNHQVETDCNFYPEMEQRGTQFTNALYGTPGLKTWYDPKSLSEVRALFPIKDKRLLFAVIGDKVYKSDTNANATQIGNVGTASGPCIIRYNPFQVCITDGTDGYIYTFATGAFQKITDPDFPGGGSLDFLDGYFIVHDPETQVFGLSALNDGLTWSSLDTAQAEGWPDNIQRVLVDHRELWLFGTDTIEPWYNSGANSFPLERISGAFQEYGIAAPYSAAKLDNSVFWLTDKGLVARSNQYVPQIISTRLLEHQIATYAENGRIDDAIGFTYTESGHVFYVLVFPSANATWVYDVPMNFWHRWASFPGNGRHRANCYAWFNNKHLVGDFENGKIYQLSKSFFDDDGNEITGQWTFPPVADERNWLFHRQLELHMAMGQGTELGDGSDPKVMMQISDDTGTSWSSERWRSAGRQGEYDRRVRWYQLGRSRNRLYRITMTDPVKRIFYGLYCDVAKGTD